MYKLANVHVRIIISYVLTNTIVCDIFVSHCLMVSSTTVPETIVSYNIFARPIVCDKQTQLPLI